MAKKRIIWQDSYLQNEDEWRDDYEEYLEETERTEDEYSIEQFIGDETSINLEAEHANLNKSTNTIIAIADLGFWNGRRKGYKVCGKNLNSIFDVLNSNYYGVEFYCDRYNVRATLPHHDNTHYLTFRELKDNKDYEKVTDAIYYNFDNLDYIIKKYTRSIRPYVAKIYGW